MANQYENPDAEHVHITHINDTRAGLTANLDNCQIAILIDDAGGSMLAFKDQSGTFKEVSVFDNLEHAISNHTDYDDLVLTLAGKQSLDATLTALAALDSSSGFLYQTGADVFTKYGFGSTANTVCQGNDSRLSDARTPLAHNHIHDDTLDLNVGDYRHLTYNQFFGLTYFNNTDLHYHLADRSRANHSGTQLASTISDFTSAVQGIGDARYASIAGVFGNLSVDNIPFYFGGNSFAASKLFNTSYGVYVGVAGTPTPTATPTKILMDRSYSSGITKDSLKFSLYEGPGGDKYGFTFGSSADIQYHSDGYHDFYYNNSKVLSVSNKGINLGNNDDPATSQPDNWITWGKRTVDTHPYYAIRSASRTYGSYTYQRLQIGHHTGIEVGASKTYGGIRFYNDAPFTGTQWVSFFDGDDDVRFGASSHSNVNVYFGEGTGNLGVQNGYGVLTVKNSWGNGLNYPTLTTNGTPPIVMIDNPHVGYRTDNKIVNYQNGLAGVRYSAATNGGVWWESGVTTSPSDANDFYYHTAYFNGSQLIDVFTLRGSGDVRILNNVIWHAGNHDSTGNPHSQYEPAFTKNTGFNKNFGTAAGTVSEGNHGHLTSSSFTVTLRVGSTDYNSVQALALRQGNLITLSCPGFAAVTTVSGAMSLRGIPAELVPATARTFAIEIWLNGASSYGYLDMENNNTYFTIRPAGATSFPAGSNGVTGFCVTYIYNSL